MTSSKKKSLLKVLKVSSIVILIFMTVSMAATVFIYNGVFKRYDEGTDKMSVAVPQDAAVYSSHSYMSGKNKLSGHLYETDSDSVIVIIPGFHAETDNFVSYVDSFCKEGFDVFTFDCTGHGESGGDSSIGFPQIIKDLNATLDYLGTKTSYKNIYLFGHSRGGYAAICALKDNENISAVVSVSGVNSAMDGIMAYSTDAIGPIAYGNYPFLWAYQTMLFGSELSSRSASDCIKASDVPVMIIQGKHDEEIPADEYSVYSEMENADASNAHLILYEHPGHDGHTTILYEENGMANPDITKFTVEFFNKDKIKE